MFADALRRGGYWEGEERKKEATEEAHYTRNVYGGRRAGREVYLMSSSAPKAFIFWSFASEEEVAMTFAPIALASWHAKTLTCDAGIRYQWGRTVVQWCNGHS